MQLGKTEIARPIPVFSVNVSVTQPRISGPIERVVISAIARLGENSDGIGNSTILAVMQDLLGWPGMEIFVQDALNELSSSLVNAVMLDDSEISLMDSPLSNFVLTENGRHILETGIIPAVDRQKDWKMVYDLIEKEFLESPKLLLDPPEIPHLETYEPGFPEDEIRQQLKLSREYSGPNVVLGEIQLHGVEWLWKTEIIRVELKDGKVLIQGKTSAFTRFLNSLDAETIADFFSWSSQAENPEITNLEALKAERITPLAKFPAQKQHAKVVIHSERTQNTPFQPRFLEILYSDSTTAPYLECAQDGEPAKLHISLLKDWKEESVSDLKTVLSPVTARLYVKGTPILADFIVETTLSEEAQTGLKDQIVAEILRLEPTETIGPAEICACALLIDSKNESVFDFISIQKDLKSLLEQIQKYAEKAEFEMNFICNRLREKLAQPSNLVQAIDLYHSVPESLLPQPETLFRDRIAEEIVRSVWNRPEIRNELNEIPQTKPLCELSFGMAVLQERLGVPMLSEDDQLPENVDYEAFSSACAEWLALHQKAKETFSTRETFCEDLAQSVRNLKIQAEEKIKAEEEIWKEEQIQTQEQIQIDEKIQANLQKIFSSDEAPQFLQWMQNPPQKRVPVEMRTRIPSRFSRKHEFQSATRGLRTVFVLDVNALVEFPEIASFQNPAFHLVVPTCVEEKLRQWRPNAPRQERNIERAFQLLECNRSIYFPNHQESSNLDSILAAAEEFAHERMFLVTTDSLLRGLAKDRNFQLLYPSHCFKMLQGEASGKIHKFQNHFKRSVNHESNR